MRNRVGNGALWLAVVLGICFLAGPPVGAEEPPDTELVVFWAEGCPFCEAELAFLDALSEEHPTLAITRLEVSRNAANRDRFVAEMEALGERIRGVPTTILDGTVWHGFNAEIASSIALAVAAELAGAPPDAPSGAADSVIDIPLVGSFDVENESLLVGTFVIALVDGFNPCSLWVLSILLALVLNTGSRRRVLAVGAVFLTVTTALYGIYIAGLYSVLSYIAYVDWIRVGVAALALAFGVVNVKDYFAFGSGPSLTIADERKPALYRRMRAVARADRGLAPVLGGTATLAVGVSLIETPCTAGFPLLWADLLAEQGVATGTAVALFGVYMLVFLFDELLVFGTAVAAMRVTKVSERHGRVLKLVGGSVMVTLAAVLLLAPDLMETVGGAIVVFLGALAVAGGLAMISRAVALPGSKPRA